MDEVVLNNVSGELVERLDNEIGKAINEVAHGGATAATVSITFTVGRDKDDEIEVAFSRKHGREEKGGWYPDNPKQERLPFEGIDSVTLSTPGQEPVTMTGEKFGQATQAIIGRAGKSADARAAISRQASTSSVWI